MSLIPWRRPRNEIRRFQDEFNDLFSRFFDEPWGIEQVREGAWAPHIDVSETNEAVMVKVELPGVNPQDVELSMTGNVLSIRGEKKEEKEEKGRSYHRVERRYGSFARSLSLPSSVDLEKIKATAKDGILTIELAKKASEKPRQISVEVQAGK